MAEFETSIDIEAPPEMVFAHLVSAERMVKWMGEVAELHPVPGGTFAVDVAGTPFRGEYLEVDPPRRVVISWGMAGSEDLPPGASRVEFTLTPIASGTALRLLHTGLPESRASTHGAGWRHYLARLQLAATGGDPGVDTFPQRRFPDDNFNSVHRGVGERVLQELAEWHLVLRRGEFTRAS